MRTLLAARVATFSLSLLLFAVAWSSRADVLYVVNFSFGTSGSGRIEVFDLATGADLGTFASGLTAPGGLAFDGAGNLYVANGNNTIVECTPGGASSIFASTGLNRPNGLAFDSSGNLYAANTGNNTIEEFTPSGVGSVFASTGLSKPIGLAFDSSGNLYAANTGSNTIEEFTPSGVGSVFASTGLNGLNGPNGLAFDSWGNLYVANQHGNPYGTGTIEKFTPGGVGSVVVSDPFALSYPCGLAFDSGGNLYAADTGQSYITKVTPNGNRSVLFLYAGLSAPNFIAIQVPEPSTWTLLAVGLLALLSLRRRRAKTE